MSDLNWGLITNGSTFEVLALTILRFEDPESKPFGGRGIDGGQDALSGNGRLVLQAKHHEDGSSAKAIADAKKEAKKIEKYLQPDHPRYNQWKNVTSWRLVTNASFNPTDLQKWQETVVPLFKKLGLAADYWDRSILETLLVKYPEITRAFFSGEPRALISIPEIIDRLPLDEPFLDRASLAGFFGREQEISSIIDFLKSDKLFLVVHGAGGIGKTRLLVEAGSRIINDELLHWQVFWANVAIMESTATWFSTIIPERETLLLVDEPQDEKILRLLTEQVGGRIGRTSKWKIAVSVRSPKDPVLSFLFSPRMVMRLEKLPISNLSDQAAEEMCLGLLRGGVLSNKPESWLNNVAKELSTRFSRHPIWITLAVHLLEEHGDLTSIPETSSGLAAFYLDEVIKQQNQWPSEQILQLLRLIALVGTVNREDDSQIDLIGRGCGFADGAVVKNIMERLVQRKALHKRGARGRLVEVKPDVMRDYLLIDWLTVDVGQSDILQPSADAEVLISEILKTAISGELNPLRISILKSLGRTELILNLSGKTISLLDIFFNGIFEAIKKLTALQQRTIARLLDDIAIFSPLNCVKVSQALRTSQVAQESVKGLLHGYEVGHDDIVLELAWAVYHAAIGSRTQEEREKVLSELFELTKQEAQIAQRLPRGLPNDGKRAADLLGRTVQGGPQFWSDFDDAVQSLSEVLLDNVMKESPEPEQETALKAFLEPVLALERTQIWSNDFTLQIRNVPLIPGDAKWKTREQILNKIKSIIADDSTTPSQRALMWHLYAKAQLGVPRSGPPLPGKIMSEIQQDRLIAMKWAKGILERRHGETEELKAARELWRWYLKFEKEGDFKEIAEQLEEIYKSNDLAGEFEPMVSHYDWEESTKEQIKKAEQLSNGPIGSIDEFIRRAKKFLPNEQELNRLVHIPYTLGKFAPNSETVRSFVKNSLSSSESSFNSRFATTISSSWIVNSWQTPSPASFNLISELLELCGNNEKKIELLAKTYGQTPRMRGKFEPAAEELKLVRSLYELFLSSGQGPQYISCIAWSIYFEWETLKPLIEKVLSAIPPEQLPNAVGNLIDSIFWSVHESCPDSPPPKDLNIWILNQIVLLPEIMHVDSNQNWHIKEILKITGRVPISWLTEAFNKRKEMETQASGKVYAVGYHSSFPDYTERISTTNAMEPEIVEGVTSLVDFVFDRGTIGFYLWEVLQKIDPEGLLVPGEIINRFNETSEWKDALRIAGIGAAYDYESAAWRKIAKPVLERAAKLDDEKKISFFSALSAKGIRSWSSNHGEVATIFTSEVEKAKERLENETDNVFKLFWEWRLKIAEAELKSEEERVKEERGE